MIPNRPQSQHDDGWVPLNPGKGFAWTVPGTTLTRSGWAPQRASAGYERFLRARSTPAAEAGVGDQGGSLVAFPPDAWEAMGRFAQAKQRVEAKIELADEGR